MRFVLALALFVLAVACTDSFAPTLDHLPGGAHYTALPTGKLVGLSHYPEELWGREPTTTSVQTVLRKDVSRVLELARRQNMPVMLGMRRAEVTNDGTSQGSFKLENALQSVDEWARGPLTPDTVAKYAPWIAAWYFIDEPFCAHCWDGRAATVSDLKTYARAWRTKIDPQGLIPLVMRVPPSVLVSEGGNWDGLVDGGWVVYKPGSRLSVTETLDREAAIARTNGWKVIAGMNAENCTRSGDSPACTPEQLRTYLGVILRHPAICASVSWRHDPDTWRRSEIRAAWQDLTDLAQALPTTTCKTVAGGETPPTGPVARIELQPDAITCVVDDRRTVSARAYDAAGNELTADLGFRTSDDTRIRVVKTGAQTARVVCLRRGQTYAVAYRGAIRDRTLVTVR